MTGRMILALIVAPAEPTIGLRMNEAWTHQLETWHEFYVLLGTA